MKYEEGKIGRAFVLRLENGDVLPDCIEKFAKDKGIKCAHVTLIGGIGKGNVVVGPKHPQNIPPEPVYQSIDGAHEVVASGVIALTDENKPVLHIHGALGRLGNTITGCLREGVEVWLVCEAIIYELLDVDVKRIKDPKSGLKLLSTGVLE